MPRYLPADERAQHGVEGARAERQHGVQIGLNERQRTDPSSCDGEHAAGAVEADRAAAGAYERVEMDARPPASRMRSPGCGPRRAIV